jgi:hypothetical protein
MKVDMHAAPVAAEGKMMSAAAPHAGGSAFSALVAESVGPSSRDIAIYREWSALYKQYVDQIKDRIAHAGFTEAMNQLRDIRKVFLTLAIVHAESADDVKDEIEKIMDDFKVDPPATAAEMMERIVTHVAMIPDNAPDNLKERMKEYCLGCTS